METENREMHIYTPGLEGDRCLLCGGEAREEAHHTVMNLVLVDGEETR